MPLFLTINSAIWIPIYISMGGLLILVYNTTTSSVQRYRRKKSKAEHDAAVVAGVDKTAMQNMQSDIKMLVELMKGRDPTWQEPHPPPGLVAVVNTHTELLKGIAPNGGDTNSTGDLVLRMGERMGVTVEEGEDFFK